MTILFLNYDAKGYPDRSRNYLSNYFNHTLGITFHTWLHTLRIQEAKRIISADPSIKISAVAASVGIPDRHCRLDRQSQVFGMTEKFFDILERKNRKFGIFAKASF